MVSKAVSTGLRKPSVNYNIEQHKLSNLNKRGKKRMKIKIRKQKTEFRDLWNYNTTNISCHLHPTREEKEGGLKEYAKKIMAEKIPKVGKRPKTTD